MHRHEISNRPQTQGLRGNKTAPKLADSDALEWMIFMGDSCEDRLCDSRVHVGWSQLFLSKAWRPSPLETRVPFLDSSLLGQPLVRGLETESPPLKQQSLSWIPHSSAKLQNLLGDRVPSKQGSLSWIPHSIPRGLETESLFIAAGPLGPSAF